jgi:hypothetical protein
MAEGLPDFSDRATGEAWLQTQPREVGIALAARAALRVAPLAMQGRFGREAGLRAAVVMPVLRATAAALFAAQRFNSVSGFRAAAAAAADAAGEASHDAYATSPSAAAARTVAAAAAAARAASAEVSGVSAANFILAAATFAADAPNFTAASSASAAVAAFTTDARLTSTAPRPLWPDQIPRGELAAWTDAREALLATDEGWEVWTDWYEARLRGVPCDLALEEARVLIPDEIWDQGPRAVNAEIRRLIAEHAAQRPQGERLDILPDTGRIGAAPAEVRDVAAWDNARDKVQDTLGDFRDSALANRAMRSIRSLPALIAQ